MSMMMSAVRSRSIVSGVGSAASVALSMMLSCREFGARKRSEILQVRGHAGG
jgi:hypothetical protein